MDEFEKIVQASVRNAVENGEGFDFGVFKSYLAVGLLDFAYEVHMLNASVAEGKQSYTVAVDTRQHGLHTVYIHLMGCRVLSVSVF